MANRYLLIFKILLSELLQKVVDSDRKSTVCISREAADCGAISRRLCCALPGRILHLGACRGWRGCLQVAGGHQSTGILPYSRISMRFKLKFSDCTATPEETTLTLRCHGGTSFELHLNHHLGLSTQGLHRCGNLGVQRR